MLTPAFQVSQDDEYLKVCIQVPYAKISEVEVQFEDSDFRFYSKPYYLRLNLPGKVVFQENPSVKYDIEKKIVTVLVPKAQKGEIFEGLDIVPLLLAKKSGKASTPLIEVLDGSENQADVEDIEDEDFDWTIEQIASKDEFGSITFHGQQCGFGNSYSFSVFNLEEEAGELFEVIAPHEKPPKIRSEERLIAESTLFSEDHYIADLYHDEEIQALIKYSPDWDGIYEEIQNNPSISADDKIIFTSDEKEYLRKLSKKEYLLDRAQVQSALLGLIDILFAFAYNKRTTEGENTVVSGWTINRLSATLSWLEVFTSVQDVALTCIRRSLIFPLYRHFELALTVLEDVVKIMKIGRKYVLKCLLEVHEVFSENDPRYILNDLYITDYNIWIQTKMCSSSKLLSLAQALEKVLLTKGDIGLNLVDIETFAKIAWMSRENPLLFNSAKTKRKERKSSIASSSGKSRNAVESALAPGLEKLSLNQGSSDSEDTESSTSDSEDDSSYYEICNSYTSDSSKNCSSVCGSDCSSSSSSSSSSSEEDSDEDTNSSS